RLDRVLRTAVALPAVSADALDRRLDHIESRRARTSGPLRLPLLSETVRFHHRPVGRLPNIERAARPRRAAGADLGRTRRLYRDHLGGESRVACGKGTQFPQAPAGVVC